MVIQRVTATRRREGHGRFHYLDNSKFCRNARGSCCEVLDHLITAHDEGLISDEVLTAGRGKVERTLQVLTRKFHSYENRCEPNFRPPFGRSDFVAVSPDEVGPPGRIFHTSECEICGLNGYIGYLRRSAAGSPTTSTESRVTDNE